MTNAGNVNLWIGDPNEIPADSLELASFEPTPSAPQWGSLRFSPSSGHFYAIDGDVCYEYSDLYRAYLAARPDVVGALSVVRTLDEVDAVLDGADVPVSEANRDAVIGFAAEYGWEAIECDGYGLNPELESELGGWDVEEEEEPEEEGPSL